MASKFKSFFKKVSDKVNNYNKQEEVKQEQRSSEQSKLDEIANKMIGKRPQSKAAKDLLNIKGFFYLTDKIIIMPFPEENIIQKIQDYLNTNHYDQYIVYNLSEYKYDNNYFNNSVMEYLFPGLPSPPLDVIFMICSSMQSWLSIDQKNVVVIHCQGTKGRSSLITSCFLSYYYYQEFDGPKDTFQYFCQISNLDPKQLLYPSQFRYLSYFEDVLNGFIPINRPLILQRIIMYGIPDFSSLENEESDEQKSDDESLTIKKTDEQKVLCAPYIQLFKNGEMFYSSLTNKNYRKLPDKFFYSDQCAIFEVGQRVENDFLVRCRHYKNSQVRESMFRASVHTSFIENNVLRLQRDDLDGSCNNKKYPNDFFIDLIFTDARNQSNLILSTNQNKSNSAKRRDEGLGPFIINKAQQPESERKVECVLNVEDEEKRLMQGTKNVENKDDFWISLWSQLQNRVQQNNNNHQNADTPYPKEDQTNKSQDNQMNSKEFKKTVFQIGRASNLSSQSEERKSIGSQNSIENNLDGKIPFNISEENHEDNNHLIKQLTLEEKERIQKMIENNEEGEDIEKRHEEEEDDLDNYLDNLEQESD